MIFIPETCRRWGHSNWSHWREACYIHNRRHRWGSDPHSLPSSHRSCTLRLVPSCSSQWHERIHWQVKIFDSLGFVVKFDVFFCLSSPQWQWENPLTSKDIWFSWYCSRVWCVLLSFFSYSVIDMMAYPLIFVAIIFGICLSLQWVHETPLTINIFHLLLFHRFYIRIHWHVTLFNSHVTMDIKQPVTCNISHCIRQQFDFMQDVYSK